MLLKELIRFSTQHRTLHCYLLLSIWIFLLIAELIFSGMYKYIGYNGNSLSSTFRFLNGESHSQSFSEAAQYSEDVESETQEKTLLKYSKFKERCAPLGQLVRHDDGGILDGWKLQGVLMVIRHGDRGPMSHMRDVMGIDCGMNNNGLVNRYRSFLYNSTSSSSSNHMYWNKVGPFHGFPLLPASERACLLGQLTFKGVAQMLHVGDILHQIYAHPLGLLIKQTSNRSSMGGASTPNSLLNSDEVVLFSTRYRRTFQSALALLFTFLPNEKWLSLNIRESHSMAFCFTDCACQQAEVLLKRRKVEQKLNLTFQPDISKVIQWVGGTLLQQTPNGVNNVHDVLDVLNTVLCHDAPLPCRHSILNNTQLFSTTQLNAIDLNDVINIDQDEQVGNLVETHYVPEKALNDEADGQNVMGCVEQSHVTALMAYANWQSTQNAEHVYYKRIGLLRAYGMMRHVVSYMLRMISGDRTKFVLYSGHDWTLQYLTAALGIRTGNTFISYATRLAFELYKSETHTDYYFRAVYNGRDVTQQIDFCEGGKSLRITRDSRGNKADLCPIENIIRFLHEDYFSSLNATNFKDACSPSSPHKDTDF
ncbi:PREDICTED: 2-phosphoxylose phosphatase 1 isoform X1 [Rhagoletis zephyria]|uniref:2-phosphoxylose phosphatase 1 isoform X1 n=1 Tax=Rhagoletis zephyria TaxID=28612 RepID=UPI0008119904|nr:PREDICTED: 2-phosphoxylose phosphatase 1 isoform X1 [Rhagoletis zephyria]